MKIPLQLALLWPAERGRPKLTVDLCPLAPHQLRATFVQEVVKDVQMGVAWEYSKSPKRKATIFTETVSRISRPLSILRTRAELEVHSAVAKVAACLDSEFGRFEGSCNSRGETTPLRYSKRFLFEGRPTSLVVVKDLEDPTGGSITVESNAWPQGMITATLRDDSTASVVAQHTLRLDRLIGRSLKDSSLTVSGEALAFAKEGPYAFGKGLLSARLQTWPGWVEVNDANQLGWGISAGGAVVSGKVPLGDPLAGTLSASKEVVGATILGSFPLGDPRAGTVSVKKQLEMPL